MRRFSGVSEDLERSVIFNGLVFRGLERRNNRTNIVRVFCLRNSKSTIRQKNRPGGRFSDLFWIGSPVLWNQLVGQLGNFFDAFV